MPNCHHIANRFRAILNWPGAAGSSLPLLVFCLSVILFSPASVQAQDGYAVQKIAFKGNKTISTTILKLLTETKSVGTFSKLLGKKGPEYDDEVMVQDIERIKAFYQREGFLYVAVAPAQKEIDQQKKTVKLTISIIEGEPFRVRQVTHSLTPSSSIPDSVFNKIFKHTSREMVLRPDTRFRDSSVILDQLLLTREFGNVGYPYVDIKPELTVSKADYTVDIDWRIESGPMCFFGDVRVTGVSKIPAPVIVRQIAFRQGDLFRLRSVEQTQQQVYGLGVFQVATATPTFAKDSGTVIPVETFVKDAKRFTTKLGVGYGTEDRIRVS
ncbi:MAG: POTRA domain-containing protein, partial [candidate division Zixibacteria bacterium]|nr:POTRA domain-containing protein [candidate division Zixibacteria bacterium]